MLKLYDTLTRQVTEVQPLKPGAVGMYTCGPTMYRDAHIGNLRSYLMADWVRRALETQGISVTHVKNITDVGHMRQEMLEQGEDKVIAAALAEGKTPAEIAQFYTDRFLSDESKLNIAPAHQFPRATDHIEDMVAMVQRLVDLGYAYEVEGNVYYSVSRFPSYGALSGNTADTGLQEGVRVEPDPLKRDSRDFTLWKAAEPGRELRWPSPWGEGFPGWHIECSAMSIKYLGQQFDIHTGGVDNIFPHHEGEIAQSEGSMGKRVVSTWVHGQHLLSDGVKMAKSTGNSFTLADIEARGIDPLAFRYLCLTAHYRTRMNFTLASLRAAQRALHRLRTKVWVWAMLPEPVDGASEADREWVDFLKNRVEDNLDMPSALALTWKLVRSDLPETVRLRTLYEYDKILGLGLADVGEAFQVQRTVLTTVQERAALRQTAEYAEADAIRGRLGSDGYVVEDTPDGARVRPKSTWEMHREPWRAVSSSAETPSFAEEPDEVEFSIGVVARNYADDVSRCIQSVLWWARRRPAELVVVDNGSDDGTGEWLENIARKDQNVRLIHADHVLGEGAAKNIVLKHCRGRTVILLDTSVEVRGDIFGTLDRWLMDATIGVVGAFGLRSEDLKHFHEGEGEAGEMDAMQAYCFAFRRSRIKDVGLMRESFRFYRNLDLDYSFQFKDKGLRIIADTTLPLRRHEHRAWDELAEGERDELSRKNYGRFLKRWGGRTDLLVAPQPAG